MPKLSIKLKGYLMEVGDMGVMTTRRGATHKHRGAVIDCGDHDLSIFGLSKEDCAKAAEYLRREAIVTITAEWPADPTTPGTKP